MKHPRPLRILSLVFLAAAAVSFPTGARASPPQGVGWHCHLYRGQTRVDFDLPGHIAYHYFSLGHPDRLVIDFETGEAALHSPGRAKGCGAVDGLHWAKRKSGTLRYVLVMRQREAVKIVRSPGPEGPESLLSVRFGKPDASVTSSDSTGEGAAATGRTTKRPRPFLRVDPGKGKIVIAIDPGHGGSDPGTHGPHGLDEKVVTLAIAKMLARKIDSTPGLEAFLTRKHDRYVGLRRRVLEAQDHHAALFISIHVNAYPRVPNVKGGAVYALSEHGASNAEAGLLARTENAADPTIGDIHFAPHNRAVNSALTHMAQRASIASGSQLGADVLANLSRYEPLYEHHVQYANFEVLRDPVIPSILIETAFLSNPRQARELHDKWFRKDLATAIYNGIREFLRNHDLRPVQLVRKAEKNDHREETAPPDSPGGRPRPGTASAYRVRPGDTLSGVALHLHVTQWRLRVYNHLHSRRLEIGQLLKVPPPTFDYKVRPGDSLSVIAEKADVSTKALREVNNLDGNRLQVGQILTVPPSAQVND